MNAKEKSGSYKAVQALALAVGLAAMLTTDGVGRGQVQVMVEAQGAGGAAAAPATPASEVPEPPVATGAPGEGAATKPNVPGGLMERAVDSAAQIYVDDSFASVEKLRAAMRLDHQKQGTLAIQKYQEIIDEFGQKLLYLNNDSYVSLTDYVRDMLLNMEVVQKGQYDQFYGLQAQKAIDAAVEARDLPGLIGACDRYFPASAVVAGLNQAAEWYFERGEFAGAGRAWQLLCKHPRATAQLPEFLHHAALAQKLAGRDDLARQIRDRLAKEFPDASGTIQGQSMNFVEHVDGVFKQAPWEKVVISPDEWPMFAGGATRNVQTEASSMAGTRLWTVNLDEIGMTASETAQARRAAEELRRQQRRYMDGEMDTTPPAASFPVVSNGQLFVHNGDRIIAMSANAGALLWSYPEKVTVPRVVPGSPYIYNRYGASRNVHDSCTIFQDQVFAVLPAPNVAVASNPRIYSPYGQVQNTRIVCLSRGDGKERWSTTASSIQIPSKGMLSFVGSPLVTRQGVFVMGRSTADAFSRLYLVRLDRETGAVTWSCYICSSSAGGSYGGLIPMGLPLAAMADDVVYVSTGQGADCAVDANVGRILWLQVTESAKTLRSSSDFYNNNGDVKPSWKANPPLIWRDALITAEAGSAVRIYNRWNGRLLGRFDPKKKDSPVETADIVLGVAGRNLICVGTKIHGLDLEKGKEAWPAVDLSASSDMRRKWGKLQGRPFLTQQYLYLPMEKGVAMLDVTKGAGGAELSGTNWSDKPQPGKESPPKPGNLLVTSEQVLIVSDTSVSGFSTWEAAEARRMSEIDAHPNEPKPYLDLAEVAFRTEKYDIAEKNMGRAVELAAAQAGGEGDLLQRIYRTNLGFAEQLAARSSTEEQARARFYFDQCKAAARNAEPNAEWRLSMATWAQTQKRPEEAADLYNDVLNDSAMRNAAFRRGENMTRAGIAAESELRALIKQHGRDTIYRKFEDQAAAALAKAQAQKDLSQLQQVVDIYPNSQAALAAAREVAQIQKDRKQYTAEIRTLHWIYQRLTDDPEKARIAVDLVQAHAAVNRWGAALSWTDRGFRLARDLSWQANGRAMTFATLRTEIKGMMPVIQEARHPALTLPLQMDLDDNRQGKATISGLLLVPVETSPALRRPDAMLVYGQNDNKIRLFDAPGFTEKWSCTLKDNTGPLLLLGYSGNVAVLVAANRAFGIDLAGGQLRWEIPLDANAEDAGRGQEQVQRMRLMQMQQAVFINGDMEMTMNVNQQAAMDPEILRATQFQTALGRPSFNTLRLVNGRLIAVTGNTLNAFDAATGKRAWPNPVTLPDGNCNVVIANEDLIVAQVEGFERNAPTFVTIEADSGRWHGTVKLDNERILWRAVSEEGTLFLVSDQRASAYDLHGDLTRDLWRRDLKTRFPTATALTIDGLVMINANNELVCLGQDTGEQRWPQPNDPPLRIDTMISQAPNSNLPALRTFVDGDTLVVQSAKGVHAYQTSDGRAAWEGSFLDDIPPLISPQMPVSSQVADPYLVLIGNGQTKSAQRAVTIFLINRVNPVTGELNNGKLDKIIPLTRQRDSAEGPIIRAWQVIDGGLAMEIGGNIYVYRSAKPEALRP